MAKKNIGLLGGSFNPPHEGHVHISREAKNMLGLDEVWWLVSPHNPLKDIKELASYDERMKQSKQISADDNFIKISDFEKKNNLQLTIDTLRELKKNSSDNFIWLMGADNLCQFHLWDEWKEIFNLVPIAVLDRDDYKKEALSSKATEEYREFMINEKFTNISTESLPIWCFLNIIKHPQSSTAIRAAIAEK